MADQAEEPHKAAPAQDGGGIQLVAPLLLFLLILLFLALLSPDPDPPRPQSEASSKKEQESTHPWHHTLEQEI